MVLYFYGTRPEKNQTLNASLRMTLSHILMFDSTRERLPQVRRMENLGGSISGT
jgi:hypothetical protein